jgi:hypothetical protein
MSPHECTAPICPLIFDPRFDPQSIPTRGHNVGTNPVSGETDISTPPELQYAYFGGSRTDAEAAPPGVIVLIMQNLALVVHRGLPSKGLPFP